MFHEDSMKLIKCKIKSPPMVVTSNLASLLKDRGLSQGDLTRLTGISRKTISRLNNRKVVRRINCLAAVKICFALSGVSTSKRMKLRVRLDALFPMKPGKIPNDRRVMN